MPEGLLIHIGADVNQALSGVREVNASLTRLNQSTLNLVRSLKNDLDPNITGAFKKGAVSVGAMKGALETLRENMRLATNPAQIIQYNRAIKDLEVNIKKVGVAGVVSGNALQSGFSKGFGALRTLANIIPGIGIAGLISLAIDPLIDAFRGAGKATEEFKEKQKQLLSIQKETHDSIAKEVTELRVLERIATNLAVPMEKRRQAVNEMQRLYPDYLAGIRDEAILNGLAATQINLAAAALFNKAFAQAAASKAELSASNILDLRKRENDLINQRNKLISQVPTTDVDLYGKAAITFPFINKELSEISAAIKNNTTDVNFFINEAAKYKVVAGDIGKVKTEITKLGKELEKASLIVVKPVLNLNDLVSGLDLKINTAFKIPLSVEIVPQVQIGETQKNLKAALDFFSLKGNTLKIPIEVPEVPLGMLKEMKESAESTAKAVSDVLAPAFSNLFTAILEGESPIKAFFDSIIQSIQQVIQKLIAAAIQAAIFSLIMPGSGGFGKAFGNILGGLSPGGNRANMGGFGGMNINISGSLAARGNDLVLIYNRTIASQGRTE